MKTIRSHRLDYGRPTTVVMPKQQNILGVVACQTNSHLKPRLVYLEDSAFPQRVEATFLLLRGDCDVDHPDFKNFRFVALATDNSRQTSGIATLWEVDEVKEIQAPPPPPKKPPTPPNPESVKAVKEHEKNLKEKAEQDKALELLKADIQAANDTPSAQKAKEQEFERRMGQAQTTHFELPQDQLDDLSQETTVAKAPKKKGVRA